MRGAELELMAVRRDEGGQGLCLNSNGVEPARDGHPKLFETQSKRASDAPAPALAGELHRDTLVDQQQKLPRCSQPAARWHMARRTGGC
jgi:hypothetical protein